jgi:arylsulfatase A-like enzyme
VTEHTLPTPTPPFTGALGRTIASSTAVPLPITTAPEGAPNVIVIVLDDVGFGTCSTFGGPVPTPSLDRVAREGLRFNQFHTTALCSPTRAALLTGRNHHAVHMGGIPEAANVFPGYDSVIPKEAATVAEILRQSGYSTSAFGKWHLTPQWEQTPTGPFDRWPTGSGFDHFYGILNAEASQYEPPMYRNTTPVAPYIGRPDYHMTEDLTDNAIDWMQLQRATNPDRPFFLYYATGAMHCPHHVAPEWSDRFRGHFDQGWDQLHEEIYQRQLALGVIPEGTTLTTRPDEVPSWESYPDRYKPVASRLMEVFAGFLAHTDAHIGRLLDEVTRLGLDDNTLIVYLTGDNGASAEGTIHGAWSAPAFQNGIPEDPEWLLAHMDDFGSAKCENHYNVGWAWALDSPFQWMKQVASHFGGTRNAMALRWPAAIAEPGGLRTQFHHVIDLAPTILAAAGVTPPSHVNGVAQLPVDGVPLQYCWNDADAPSTRTTQYFEMFGNRALYHDGWIASCFHGRVPWDRFGTRDFDGPEERWELYNITEDFSQGVDLAEQFPEKLADLRERFDAEAVRNNVFPLREPGSLLAVGVFPPTNLGARTSMTYTRAHVRMPERSVINLKNCSYRISAEVTVQPDSHGVIVCQGGAMAGWTLYLDDDRHPVYHYNWLGHEHTVLRGAAPVAPGAQRIVVAFAYDGGFGGGGLAVLEVDGVAVASGRIARTVPIVYSMSGETFDVGLDAGSPVGPYPHHYPFVGEIAGVTLERLSEPPADIAARIAAGEFRASLATQ